MIIPTTCKTIAGLLMATAVLQGCTPTPKTLGNGITGNTVVKPEPVLEAPKLAANSEYVMDSDQHIILASDNTCVRTSNWSEGNNECGSSFEAVEEVVEYKNEMTVGSTLVSLNGSALFEFDSATLTEAGRMELNELTSQLNSQNEIKQIEIVGHADSVGSDSYNQVLSELRAAATKEYLQRSLQTVAVTAKGMGESSPIADNSTDEGRRLNRRVDVVIAAKVDS